MTVKEENHKRRKALIVIIIILIPLLIASLWMLWDSPPAEEKPIMVPDYAPENSEPYAEVIPGDTGEFKESNGGGSVTLNFSDSVVVDLSKETVSLFFANPKRSTHDLILQVIVKEEVIAQSELIPAGYQIETLDLIPGISDQLQTGGYDASFMVHYYDQNSKARAIINTNIPVRIQVKV